MGTYKSIRIMADTTNQEEVNAIYAVLKEHNAQDCWGRFCEETKWWPDELISKLRVKFPHVMFRLDYDGVQTQPEFFLGDQAVEGHWVLPYFPSESKFNSGVRAKKAYKKRIEEERQKKAADEEKVRAAEKEAQERKQLEELKLKYG